MTQVMPPRQEAPPPVGQGSHAPLWQVPPPQLPEPVGGSITCKRLGQMVLRSVLQLVA